MKLIIISTVKECKKDIASILASQGVYNFSLVESKVYQIESKVKSLDDWFGTGSGTVEEVLIQSVVTSEQAMECIMALNQYNAQDEMFFKVKAYVVNVEQKTI